MRMTVTRRGTGPEGSKPDECAFKLSMHMRIPVPPILTMAMRYESFTIPDILISKFSGPNFTLAYKFGFWYTGKSTMYTRYNNFVLRSTGFWAHKYVDVYRKGLLWTTVDQGTAKLFAANGCN
jgi:hypothetical protein